MGQKTDLCASTLSNKNLVDPASQPRKLTVHVCYQLAQCNMQCVCSPHKVDLPAYRSFQYMDEVVTTQTQDRCLCQQSRKTKMGQCQTDRQGSACLLSR